MSHLPLSQSNICNNATCIQRYPKKKLYNNCTCLKTCHSKFVICSCRYYIHTKIYCINIKIYKQVAKTEFNNIIDDKSFFYKALSYLNNIL